jgi:hypothetical protein
VDVAELLIGGKSFSPKKKNRASLALLARVPRRDRCLINNYKEKNYIYYIYDTILYKLIDKILEELLLDEFYYYKTCSTEF